MTEFLPATASNLAALGIGLEHHFGGGAYIKAVHIRPGQFLAQHVHEHDHLAVLVMGVVRLRVDDKVRELTGFQVLTIEKGRMHSIEAVTDATWLCVWSVDDTDPATVDQTILKG